MRENLSPRRRKYCDLEKAARHVWSGKREEYRKMTQVMACSLNFTILPERILTICESSRVSSDFCLSVANPQEKGLSLVLRPVNNVGLMHDAVKGGFA